MLASYLKIALRNLTKHRAYAAINILGLAVGMAACFLIFVYVQDEARYDRFHERAERIFRVVRERQQSEYEWRGHALTPWRLAGMLEGAFPEIEEAVRITRQEPFVRSGSQQFKEARFFLADSNFFEVFSFELLAGDPDRVLDEPFSVVLTETTARKYFGDANPVGRTLTVDGRHDFTVTGVAADVPDRSHLHFDLLASLSSTEIMWQDSPYMFEHMGAIWLYTYVLLRKPSDVHAVRARMPAVIDRHLPGPNASASFHLPIQPLTDIHLKSHYEGEIEPGGDVDRLYLLAAVGFIILVLGCVNFMNLATARSAWRTKEVAVRKVIGARRTDLIRQFLGEAFVLGFAALAVAIALVGLALPIFNDLTGKTYDVGVLLDPQLAGALLAITLLTSALAGSYPAFFLSAFRPIDVLRRRLGIGRGGSLVRQGLVAFQFAVTTALLIATGVVVRQLGFIQDKTLGFDEENVAAVSLNHAEARQNYARFKEGFLTSSHVVSAAAASNHPPDNLNTWGIDWDGRPDDTELSIRVLVVDPAFLETMGLEIVAGRGFLDEEPTSFVLNEAAVRQFGFDEPVGTHVRFPVGDQIFKEGTVVGVVEDFHLGSLREEIRPLVLAVDPSWYDRILVRVRPGDLRDAVAALETEWKRLAPGWPFEYSFVDEDIEALYRSDRRLSRIFGTFAGLAVFIACLGLLGLAAFTTEKRRKEIGVRKVLGAGAAEIVRLLSGEFVRLVLVGFAVAVPVAYWIMSHWLEDFAYRISIGVELFALAGLLAVGAAVAAVALQTVRAARRNPVESLRYE